ncbi:hypothetical protein H5410_049614 [Solanum commersonii]|uniref:Uncharacterized protein n=1 Tax=Solanum commersonii TaxID=4109 RepID=A0A9J5WSX9_SOLCO|nr:hypothetical protein H5410_049614 [Solanum commersonii]
MALSTCFRMKFFMNVHYNLINSVSWYLGKNRHIFKFKQPQRGKNKFYHFLCVIVHEFLVIQDSGLFLTKIFHECLL